MPCRGVSGFGREDSSLFDLVVLCEIVASTQYLSIRRVFGRTALRVGDYVVEVENRNSPTRRIGEARSGYRTLAPTLSRTCPLRLTVPRHPCRPIWRLSRNGPVCLSKLPERNGPGLLECKLGSQTGWTPLRNFHSTEMGITLGKRRK